MSTAEKEAFLLQLFPTAGNRAGHELLIAKGNLEEAAAILGERIDSGSGSEQEVERSISPGVGPSCPRPKAVTLKRRAEASVS